jgi:hypothetical protein
LGFASVCFHIKLIINYSVLGRAHHIIFLLGRRVAINRPTLNLFYFALPALHQLLALLKQITLVLWPEVSQILQDYFRVFFLVYYHQTLSHGVKHLFYLHNSVLCASFDLRIDQLLAQFIIHGLQVHLFEPQF